MKRRYSVMVRRTVARLLAIEVVVDDDEAALTGAGELTVESQALKIACDVDFSEGEEICVEYEVDGIRFIGPRRQKVCDNCGAVYAEDDARINIPDIDNLYERLDPGGVVPAGQCPACGALCYIQEVEHE